MTHSITVHKNHQFPLYRCDKKDDKLRHKIFVASTIWNHFIALQRRYYRMTGKYISLNQMNKHVLKLRKMPRFALWQDLQAQVCQNVCRRIDQGYQRFFEDINKGRPGFKKARKYKSFTFPQKDKGYQMVDYNRNQPKGNDKWTRERGIIRIDGTDYKFVQHRPIQGQIKTLTVKRDNMGQLWLFFSVIETISIKQASTGKSGGFDFGLKTFLTDDEGRSWSSPQFFTQGLRQTRTLNRQLSRKVQGSNHHKRAKRALAKHSADVANRRRDFHFKLAHRLCDAYDIIYIEDLNMEGMKRLWGRKVSDLAFAQFVEILEWVALKRGKQVVKIDRWYPSTQRCSACKFVNQQITLRDREWCCPECKTHHQRDHNAAKNIKTAGASAVYQSERKTRVRLRSHVDGSSPRL
ncbi:MAG: transposase [Chloroflexi bacterium]|nr:transposase [Chloroflexota bacterium]